MPTITTTQYFHRQATHPGTQLQAIDTAYRLFGLEPPTRAQEIRRTVEAGAQNVRTVADTLARDAFLSDENPDEWYEGALAKIREAAAREELAKAFSSAYSDNIRMVLPKLLETAIDDIGSHVDKVVKKVATAARKLPTGTPLDAEASIAADTGQHLTTVREGLQILGQVVSIRPAVQGEHVIPREVMAILPIVTLPDAVVEQLEGGLGESRKAVNEASLGGTRTIRRLATDAAREGIDIALTRIAQGEYEGAELSFATNGELAERRANARRAFERTRA